MTIIYKPCKTCGIMITDETYMKGRRICKICNAADDRIRGIKRRATKAESLKAYRKAYNELNKLKIKERNRQYRLNNLQHLRAIERQYYYDHKDERLSSSREYAVSNSEKIREQKKSYNITNSDKIKEIKASKYTANKDTVLEKAKQYYIETKKEITDAYVKRILRHKLKDIPTKLFPKEVIAVTTTEIKLKRLLKGMQNVQTK